MSQVSASAMSLPLIIRNWRSSCYGVLHWHKVHANFHEHRTIGSNNENVTWIQRGDLISFWFECAKSINRNRLKW